jgi:hypothetical protein
MKESFHSLRKFWQELETLGFGDLPAKARRALSLDNYFLCGLCVPSAEFILSLAEGLTTCFAGDIPILLVAA